MKRRPPFTPSRRPLPSGQPTSTGSATRGRAFPTGDKAGNLMKAIAMYEAALSVSTKDANPVEWATMQNDLGTAWNVLPTGHKTENLKKAIMAYKAALSVRPDALYPVLRRSIESSLSWNELLTKDFVGACRRVSRAANEDAGDLALQAVLRTRTSPCF